MCRTGCVGFGLCTLFTYGIFHDFPFRSAVESYIETEVTTTTLTFTTSTGTSNWAGEVTNSEKLV